MFKVSVHLLQIQIHKSKKKLYSLRSITCTSTEKVKFIMAERYLITQRISFDSGFVPENITNRKN